MDSVPALDHGRVNQANSPLSSNSSSPSVLHPNFDRNPLTFKPRVNVDFDELHDKLRWEYGPLADPQRIRDILILCDMDLADYDGEIALQTQSQVIYAQAQRMRLFEYKTQLSGLLSPIRLLPNEILRIVFEFARTENLLQDYPWFSDMGFGPPTKLSSSAIAYLPALAISAVCKRWRVQGLALTHLWSQLRLEISYLEEEEEEESWSQTHEGFISTLQLYLGRSVDASLHIDLEIRGFWEDPSRIPALDLLLRHSRRWKTFKDTGDCMYKLAENQYSFPNLRDLTLHRVNDLLIQSDFETFRDAPKLCAITSSNGVELMSTLSRHQLTFLDVGLYCVNMDNLRDFPNLAALSLAPLPWQSPTARKPIIQALK